MLLSASLALSPSLSSTSHSSSSLLLFTLSILPPSPAHWIASECNSTRLLAGFIYLWATLELPPIPLPPSPSPPCTCNCNRQVHSMQISMHAQWLNSHAPSPLLLLLLMPPLTAVAASSSNRQTTQTVSASASTFYLAQRKINLSAVCTAHPLKHTHTNTHTQLQQLTTTTTKYNYNKLRHEQQQWASRRTTTSCLWF